MAAFAIAGVIAVLMVACATGVVLGVRYARSRWRKDIRGGSEEPEVTEA